MPAGLQQGSWMAASAPRMPCAPVTTAIGWEVGRAESGRTITPVYIIVTVLPAIVARHRPARFAVPRLDSETDTRAMRTQNAVLAHTAPRATNAQETRLLEPRVPSPSSARAHIATGLGSAAKSPCSGSYW